MRAPVGVFGASLPTKQVDSPSIDPNSVILRFQDKSYTFVHQPGTSLGEYLALAKRRMALTRFRAYDTSHLAAGPIRSRYVVPGPTTILFTPPGVSPILDRFQRTVSSPEVSGATPEEVEVPRGILPAQPDPARHNRDP